MSSKDQQEKTIKVVIWDLDETLWDGILAEGDEVRLRPGVLQAIETLDSRGILHSVASKNDHEDAMAKLRELGIDGYFLYPQISWSSKAEGVRRIAESINVGLDAVCFVDDQPFEREEVTHSLPEVMTVDATEAEDLPSRPELMPRFITDESRIRRQMYQADVHRNSAEEGFVGPQEDFLSTLDMEFTVAPATREDLERAEELTVRTHQLNTTGYTYSYEELDAFRTSPDHLLLVASLVDRYGTYGKIGLALVETGSPVWNIHLLLMSCRVMSRGVGTILLNHIMGLARDAGARLTAEFRSNDRNRMMLVTYKFAGFKEVDRRDDLMVLENDLSRIQPPPGYVRVRTHDAPVPVA